jgi:hypothetical protein
MAYLPRKRFDVGFLDVIKGKKPLTTAINNREGGMLAG